MTDMQKKSFGTMLSPIRAGQHMLRNRVIMGSMHTRLETEPDSIARQIAFYAERARGEAAILVTGGFAPNAEKPGRHRRRSSTIWILRPR